MKYLLLTLDYPPNRQGGMSNYFAGLAAHAPPQSLVVLTGRGSAATHGDVRVPLYRAPVRSGAAVWIPLWTLLALRVMRREGATMLLCGNASPFRHVARLVAALSGAPYAVHFFGTDALRLARRAEANPRTGAEVRRTLARARAVITCSAHTASITGARFGVAVAKQIVSYPGIDDEFIRQDAPMPRLLPGETLRLLTVGRLTARKGVDRVIEALAVLRERNVRAHLTVVGKGDQRRLLSLARERGLEAQVSFAGFLPGTPEVIAAVRDAHVFVMVPREEAAGSDIEGFGTVFIEAAALGRPAVGSCSGGAGEAVIDGVTGLLVRDPDCAAGIAEAIGRFADNPALLQSMGAAARQRALSEFSWSRIAPQLFTKLDRLAAGGPANP